MCGWFLSSDTVNLDVQLVDGFLDSLFVIVVSMI